MNNKAQMITIFFSLFLILAIVTILGIESANLKTNENLNSLEQAYNLPKLEYYNFLNVLSKTSNINPSNSVSTILNSTLENIYNNFFQNLNVTAQKLNTSNLMLSSEMNLYINGAEDSNNTVIQGTQSNFTAIVQPSTYYVSLYVNGVKEVSLSQGKATYLNTLPTGSYKVTAATNTSGVANITYYESVKGITLYLNGAEDSNNTIYFGTESNFTAVIAKSTDYVSLYVNGVKEVSLSQGKATYLDTLSAGSYKVTAASNTSGVSNVTYYETVKNRPT
jgi:hypothetical protein